MRNKLVILILIPLLFVSCVTHVIMARYLVILYRQYKLSHIDPANLLLYSHNRDTNKPKVKEKIRIVLFGDSRIALWNPLPTIQGCELVNRGVSGETTTQSLLRINQDVISLKPDIVVIEVGGNDCNAIGALPEMQDYIVSKCKNNMKAIANILRQNHIEVIVLTIFPAAAVPPWRWPVWSDKTREAISDINAFLSGLNASGITVLNCDAIFLARTRMKSEYANDLLHINSDGYTALNSFLQPHMVRIVTGLKKRD